MHALSLNDNITPPVIHTAAQQCMLDYLTAVVQSIVQLSHQKHQNTQRLGLRSELELELDKSRVGLGPEKRKQVRICGLTKLNPNQRVRRSISVSKEIGGTNHRTSFCCCAYAIHLKFSKRRRAFQFFTSIRRVEFRRKRFITKTILTLILC